MEKTGGGSYPEREGREFGMGGGSKNEPLMSFEGMEVSPNIDRSWQRWCPSSIDLVKKRIV